MLSEMIKMRPAISDDEQAHVDYLRFCLRAGDACRAAGIANPEALGDVVFLLEGVAKKSNHTIAATLYLNRLRTPKESQ